MCVDCINLADNGDNRRDYMKKVMKHEDCKTREISRAA
jgi:hypothetical protein